jgi:hypothetical protein
LAEVEVDVEVDAATSAVVHELHAERQWQRGSGKEAERRRLLEERQLGRGTYKAVGQQ